MLRALLKITILLFPLSGLCQGKFYKVTLPGSKVEILAPQELQKMTDQMWTLKYPKRPRPLLVLTSKNGEVNLIADMTQQAAAEDQMASFKDFQLAQLKKQKSGLKILADGVRTVNGKNVGYYKFVSPATGGKVFNYYFFTVVTGKILFFTFNCIDTLQNAWEKTADQIVASLRIR